MPSWLCAIFILFGLQMSPSQIFTSFKRVMPLCGPTCPNEPTHPFADQHTQMNPCARQTSHPLGHNSPTLGAFLMLTCRTLFGVPILVLHLMLGKPLDVFSHPRNPLSQLVRLLGSRAITNSISLRTWMRVPMPF